MIWGFLLGPVGVVLAVPLTMAITRLVKDRTSKERERLEPDVG
jgi:predicted PurR-regulated permease PerM